jgi:hypothetical protein
VIKGKEFIVRFNFSKKGGQLMPTKKKSKNKAKSPAAKPSQPAGGNKTKK